MSEIVNDFTFLSKIEIFLIFIRKLLRAWGFFFKHLLIPVKIEIYIFFQVLPSFKKMYKNNLENRLKNVFDFLEKKMTDKIANIFNFLVNSSNFFFSSSQKIMKILYINSSHKMYLYSKCTHSNVGSF